MAGLRVRKKAQAREALIDAAIRLFGERGIDATSVDDIAAAAVMSRGTFFNYFPYKEAILVDIGARLVAEVAQHMAQLRRGSPREMLYDLADAVASIAERYPVLVGHITREMSHIEPERRRFAAEGMRYPELYQGLLRELESEGWLRWPGRRTSLERQLVDITTGTLVRAGNEFPIEQLRDELRANVDLFCDGAIKAQPGPLGTPDAADG